MATYMELDDRVPSSSMQVSIDVHGAPHRAPWRRSSSSMEAVIQLQKVVIKPHENRHRAPWSLHQIRKSARTGNSYRIAVNCVRVAALNPVKRTEIGKS